MPEGKVKWFDSQKGYGFIEHEKGKDLFVHQDEVTGNIKEGDAVTFEVGQGRKGPCALKVKKA
jgi:CspA family cold shock protein